VTVEDGKAAQLEAMLEHTTWPDEDKIDHFVIGLFGRDRALLRVLNREVPKYRVRGKPVVVRYFTSLSDARSAHILVLSPAKNSKLAEIERELRRSHTLTVTDGSTDQRHIMINFTHPSETRLSFEINRSNIVYAGLQLSKSILLFGGTELDAATIYKETEAELIRAKAVATRQQQQLEIQLELLDEQKHTIERQREQVAANKTELANLEQKLSGIQTTLEQSENRLRENEAALMEKEAVLAEKEAYIESYSARIERNLERLEDQQSEIKQQEKQIAEQSNVLMKQLSTIESQQLILGAGAAALLLVLTLIAIIFRGYRSKHRIAMKLEGKTRELQVANEQLVQMTEAKSRFLSTMSHEIRTPMNGVIGMAELLDGTELGTQQREYVSLIIKSADTLLGLLNDILDFSKIEAGRLDLEAIPFKLRDILGDTLQSLGLRAGEKGLELALHIPPDVPDSLVGDPIRLRQIVVNLVGNAIKFTGSGEVVLDLRLESATGRAARIRFEVRDTGVGITDAQQRKIFEAFGQADSSTTREFGGTGLGLAITSQLTEMMGGNLVVKSEAGRGSTFSFSADFDLVSEPKAEPSHPAGLQGRHVLVVDDNSTNRAILEELLSNWGMVVNLADSGENALAELDRAESDGRDFAVAILDVMMPHMDGFELAAGIRDRSGMAKVPLVMLTSAGRPDQEALRSQLDISRILLKPTKHSDLLVAITDALGITTAETRAAGPGKRPEDLPIRQVLLVEDNPVNQKVAMDLLTRRGHSIELAENGKEAVALVARKEFDVVLMDVHMPVMDGLAATRAIRQQEQSTGAHVPIIAMTAGATLEDRERSLAAGMDDFVTKPFRARELYATVEDASPGRERREVEAQSPASGDESCLDWQGALRKLDGDHELLLELSEMFQSQSPALVLAIMEAIAGQQPAELRRAAHTLKGSAQVIGAQAAAAAALQLEHIGRDGRLEAADSAFRTLEIQLARLEAELQDIMEGPVSATGSD
jgi:signal transduction histidine kinase/CheY-like chemotaxis protein